MGRSLKFAISGKGGAGKTTLAALLAGAFSSEGRRVVAVDADPAANLAAALGVPEVRAAELVPIAVMDDLIEERTGARPGESGGFFRLNPRVDDLPETCSIDHRGIRLLRLGAVTHAGQGCMCPESALLKALITHLLLGDDDVVIIDMEAGVEHLGRGSATGVDAFLIVTEPSRRSLGVAGEVVRLAGELGIERLLVVGNRIRNEDDAEYVRSGCAAPVIGMLPEDPSVLEADRKGIAVFDAAPRMVEAANGIIAELSREL